MTRNKRKKCYECGKRRSLTKFDDRKDSKDGKKNICVDCRSTIRLKSKYRYSDYKYGANRRNLNFNLTLDKFKEITSKPCYYCGGYSGEGYEEKKYNGIDRIESNKGYIDGNCVSACAECNYMKRHTDTKAFFKQIRKISEHHNLIRSKNEGTVDKSGRK